MQPVAIIQPRSKAGQVDRHTPLASEWGVIRTLVNSAVSSGVLSIPLCFQRSGWLLTCAIVLVSAVAMVCTSLFLWTAAESTQTTDYLSLVRNVAGSSSARAVFLIICIGQLGACASYFRVMRTGISVVLQRYAYGCTGAVSSTDCDVPWFAEHDTVLLGITICVLVPLVLLATPESLARMSLFPWIHFGGFMLLLLMRLGTDRWQGDMEHVASTDNIYSTAAIIALAFELHTTLLSIISGTKPPLPEQSSLPAGDIRVTICTLRRDMILRIIIISFGITLAYYLFVGFVGYGLFGASISANLLDSFDQDDLVANIARCSYTIELSTSVPIYVYTLRRYMVNAVFDNRLEQVQLDDIENSWPWTMALVSLCIVALCLVIGTQVDFEVILTISGALCSCVASYVVPSLLYNAILQQRTWGIQVLVVSIAATGTLVAFTALYTEISSLAN